MYMYMYVCTIEATVYVYLCFLCPSRLGTTGGMWYRELSRGVGQVWELQHVAVTLEGTQGRHLSTIYIYVCM